MSVGFKRFFRFSQKQRGGSVPIFLQGLEENTSSLQPALKNTAPGLYAF